MRDRAVEIGGEDRHGLSVEQWENDFWGPASAAATDLVRRCHRLRTVPIGTLTTAEMMELIGQGIGLDALVPVVIDTLRNDPFDDADYFYPGALLESVLRLPCDWLAQRPAQVHAISELVQMVCVDVEGPGEEPLPEHSEIPALVQRWRARTS